MAEGVEAEFRQVLIELQLCAEGRTQNFEGRVSGSGDRSPILRQVEEPPQEALLRRWRGCRTDRAREAVLRDARAVLRAIRHRPRPPRESIPWQEMVARDPRPTSVVAEEWRITTRYVRQLRAKYANSA